MTPKKAATANLPHEAHSTWGKVASDKISAVKSTEPVRGYIKLSQAAKAFGYDFRDKIVLDIGSSTGGFTKYTLDHGAKHVVAVEKGTNQMMKPLRFDTRITLHEKTDIFNTSIRTTVSLLKDRHDDDSVVFIEAPDVIVADVSFVSLKKILKHAKSHLSTRNTDFLVMLKPQFEAAPSEMQNGVVKNETIRRQIIKNFEFWLKSNHFVIIKKRDNDLKGKTGNKERFYWLKNEQNI